MRVGPYEVLDVVATGGTSFVARGRAPDGATVAIKLLKRAGFKGSPEEDPRVGRFERERRLGSALGEAEGFVPVVDSGVSPLGFYIVMPFVEGGTLRERLSRGPLALAEAVALARRLARSLGEAHARGIVHRDLKPENVLWREGRPLIADLGIAKHFRDDVPGASESETLTRAGAMCGTYRYMSPEQFQSARDVDARADVFSLGVLLYECLTGIRPFDGETLVEIRDKIQSGAFVSLARFRPDTPAWLAVVVARCLSVDPRGRFRDGFELARALDRRATDRPGRRIVTLAALTVAVAAPIAWIATRPPESRPSPPPLPPPIVLRAPVKATLAATWGSAERKHAAMVCMVQFDASGKRVMTSSLDRTCKLWDVETGREVLTFTGHTDEVYPTIFLDEKRALSAGKDHAFRIWDTTTGKELRTIPIDTSLVRSIAAAPDGRTVFAIVGAGSLHAWDLDRGAIIRDFPGRVGNYGSLSVSPGGQTLLSGSDAGPVQLWDMATGREVARLGTGGVTAAFSPDGQMAATGTGDGVAHLWDLTSGVEVRALVDPAPRPPRTDLRVSTVAFTPDGKKLLTSSFDKSLRLFDVASGELIRRFEGHTSFVLWAAISPDGTRVVSGSNDQTVRIWDLATGHELLSNRGLATKAVALAVGPDGRRALASSFDGLVTLWDVASGREEWSFPYGRPTRALGLSATGDALVGVADEVRIRDASGIERSSWPLAGVSAIACAPIGSVVVTGDVEGRVVAWSGGRPCADVRTGESVAVVAISRDGLRAASAGESGRVELWDLATKTSRWSAAGRDRAVVSLALVETRLLVADAGGIRVHELNDGADRWIAIDGLMSAAFAPDGRLAVAVTNAGVAVLLDLDAGREVERFGLGVLGGRALSAAFAPDGRWFLVGTDLGVIRRFTLGP